MTSDEIRKIEKDLCDKLDVVPSMESAASLLNAAQTQALIEIAAQLADSQVSLRDRMAMAAMQAIPSEVYGGCEDQSAYDLNAKRFYRMADAMLRAREDKQ